RPGPGSEAGELVASDHDPEAEAVAAGALRTAAAACGDARDGRQVRGLPERDRASDYVGHQNALPVEGCREWSREPVAGQRRQDRAVGRSNHRDGTQAVGRLDVRAVEDRVVE